MFWFRSFLGRSARPASARRHRLAVEGLEDRSLPSITLPTPGTPGPVSVTGTDHADQFVIRLQSGSPTNVQFSDDGGTTFQTAALADVQSVTVQGLGGKDTLTIDLSNGLVGNTSTGGLPISFDGGTGKNVLFVQGDAGQSVAETYTPGATSDAGTLALTGSDSTGLSVSFSNLTSVVDTATATQLTVNLPSSDNVIQLDSVQGPGAASDDPDGPGGHGPHGGPGRHGGPGGWGDGGTDQAGGTAGLSLLRIGGIDQQGLNDALCNVVSDNTTQPSTTNSASFVPISVANAAAVTVNAGDANDVFLLNAASTTGLTSLALDGGAGTDKVIEANVPSGVTLTTPNVEQTLANDSSDAFIYELYLTRLRRLPSDTDLTFWEGVLTSQGRAAVVAGIDASAETAQGRVGRWYEAFLGREAGASETSALANLMQTGASEQTVLTDVLLSPEFQANASSQAGGTASADSAFVTGLYQDLLNRSAGATEVTAVTGLLATTSRAQVVQSFLNSPEHLGDVAQGLFGALLNRSADTATVSAVAGLPGGAAQMRQAVTDSLECFSASLASATPVTLNASGQGSFSGTTQNRHDDQVYSLAASANGTLSVTVTAAAGQSVKLDAIDASGTRLLDLSDGTTSGSFAVSAGQTYYLQVRSAADSAATFQGTLSLT